MGKFPWIFLLFTIQNINNFFRKAIFYKQLLNFDKIVGFQFFILLFLFRIVIKSGYSIV